MTEPQGDTDFFISYRGARADWALWVNWVVRSAGYSTVLMDEFKVGSTWTNNMRKAAENCRRLIPLYSVDYWQSGACVEEFDAYWPQHMQDANARFILPLEVQPCQVPAIHKPLLWKPLHPLTHDAARDAILKVLDGITSVSTAGSVDAGKEPTFPGIKPATATASPPPPFNATATKVDRKDFVNCTAAFEAFERMMTEAPCEQILLVHGHGKQGKSTLLTLLFHHARTLFGSKSAAFAEFKLGGSGPEEIVRSIARSLGVSPPSGGNIDERVDALLDTCTDRPTILFFDAYEHAELPHQHWVGRVLQRCVDDANLRVVVAGRSLPPAKGKLWAHLSFEAECDALKEQDAIIDHALANGYKGKPEDIRLIVTSMTRVRDRLIKEGHCDHGICSESVLAEIRSMCAGGTTIV